MTTKLSVPGTLTSVIRWESDKTYLEFRVNIDVALMAELVKLGEANTPLTITVEAEETSFTTTGVTGRLKS